MEKKDKEKDIKETNKAQKPKTKEQTKEKTSDECQAHKDEINKLKDQIINLNAKVISLELENQKSIETFKLQAVSFEKKAQEKVNELKNNLSQKLEDDKLEVKKYGSQKLLEAIIEPLLNIELAVKVGSNQEGAVSNYVRGFEMLLNQLNSELESLGITRIEPKVGDEFDPELHYAISTKEGQNKNKIVEVKKPGYKLHDRVVKPATVVIEN